MPRNRIKCENTTCRQNTRGECYFSGTVTLKKTPTILMGDIVTEFLTCENFKESAYAKRQVTNK